MVSSEKSSVYSPRFPHSSRFDYRRDKKNKKKKLVVILDDDDVDAYDDDDDDDDDDEDDEGSNAAFENLHRAYRLVQLVICNDKPVL
ncbi:hypothetical protein HZH68_014569 [Vespula germanica]|uniref:Uncharacterized protein n=1 Tax=Vespula germanica TaxID=30212 RepID=A0A834J9B3_VESGE|nr:hypothetical protein HZH68_014569 [Vespula germanica]